MINLNAQIKKTSSSSSNSSLVHIEAKNEDDIIVHPTLHEENFSNSPKSQSKVTIVLDSSMIPPEHDDKHPIVGGVAVSS